MERFKLISISLSLILLTTSACGQLRGSGGSPSSPSASASVTPKTDQDKANEKALNPEIVAFKQVLVSLDPNNKVDLEKQKDNSYTEEQVDKIREAVDQLINKFPSTQSKNESSKKALEIEKENLSILYILLKPLGKKVAKSKLTDIESEEFTALENNFTQLIGLDENNKERFEILKAKITKEKATIANLVKTEDKFAAYVKLIQDFLFSQPPENYGAFNKPSNLKLYETLQTSAKTIEDSSKAEKIPHVSGSPSSNPDGQKPGTNNDTRNLIIGIVALAIAGIGGFAAFQYLPFFVRNRQRSSSPTNYRDRSKGHSRSRQVDYNNLPGTSPDLQQSTNPSQRSSSQSSDLDGDVRRILNKLANDVENIKYDVKKLQEFQQSTTVGFSSIAVQDKTGISDIPFYQAPLPVKGMDRLVQTYQNSPKGLNILAKVSESPSSINQRRTNPNLTPELVESNNFNYLVVQDLENAHIFWLFPKNNLKVNQYNIETVETLFECQNYVNSPTTTLQVLQPASVSKNVNSWRLIEKGTLVFTDLSTS